jgi:hypothetical protein
MKMSQFLLGAVFVVGCATGAAVREIVVPARAQGQAPFIYQYSTFNLQDLGLAGGSPEEREAILNRYGQQGWRVAAATTIVTGTLIIFERAIPLTPRLVPPPSSAPPPSSPPPRAP